MYKIKTKRRWLQPFLASLILLFMLFANATARGQEGDNFRIPRWVRVRVFSTQTLNSLKIYSPGLKISSTPGQLEFNSCKLSMIPGKREIKVSGKFGEKILRSPLRLNSNSVITITSKDGVQKKLPGQVVIRNTSSQLIVIARISFENYLTGVVQGELPSAPGEALKAQAIASRSYALKNLRRHKNEGFDFCDSTHCQYYRGFVPPGTPHHRAVRETLGMVLTIGGQPVQCFYHSTCGGETSPAQSVFGSFCPGITSIKDSPSPGKPPFCSSSHHFRWKLVIPDEKLNRILSGEPDYSYLKKIEKIIVLKTGPGGRVENLTLVGKDKQKNVSGYDFWQMMGDNFGWGKFKSSWFRVKKVGNNFVFTGRGLGHGVGMCQEGAINMAQKGYTYKQILKHYFPGTEITVFRPSDL